MRRWFWSVIVCLSFAAPAVHAAAASPLGNQQPSPSQAIVRGHVVDSSHAAIVDAQVTVTSDRVGVPVSAVTDAQGEFEVALQSGSYVVRISAVGFDESSRRVTVGEASPTVADFTLDVAGIQESVSVGAAAGYSVPAVSSATKTNTPLRDVPQAVSVVTRELIADQRMASMADVTRYMPGVGFAQGEGNRDTPSCAATVSTSDFFVDGVRDDVQYFRDRLQRRSRRGVEGPQRDDRSVAAAWAV